MSMATTSEDDGDCTCDDGVLLVLAMFLGNKSPGRGVCSRRVDCCGALSFSVVLFSVVVVLMLSAVVPEEDMVMMAG